MKASIIVPKEYVGAVMELCNDRRGTFDHMEYLSPARVHLTYELPLAEIVLDFYDQLKSRTRGYASFDYDFAGFKAGEPRQRGRAGRGESVDALSLIIHRDFAYDRGRMLVEKLREEIPRQMFDVPIQAAIGSRVIARETVKARRKDVLAKCYGGDISRKRKLLEKQKAGKKRMKQVGAVEVPQEAFLAVLNIGAGAASRAAMSAPARVTSTSTCRFARTGAVTATSSRSSGARVSTTQPRLRRTRCCASWSSGARAARGRGCRRCSSAAARRRSPHCRSSSACSRRCRRHRR